jgi:hypothetical protein
MSKPKKRRPSFDIARPEAGGDTRAGWVYRSDPSEPPVAPAVELIPPGRGTLQRLPPEPAPQQAALALSALSFGLGVAMMPVFATMFVMLVPMRWLLGAPPASQTADASR